jgi:mRNA interferase HicA
MCILSERDRQRIQTLAGGPGMHVEEGTKHTKVLYKGQWTMLPRHGAREMKTGTAEGIKKKLGLK